MAALDKTIADLTAKFGGAQAGGGDSLELPSRPAGTTDQSAPQHPRKSTGPKTALAGASIGTEKHAELHPKPTHHHHHHHHHKGSGSGTTRPAQTQPQGAPPLAPSQLTQATGTPAPAIAQAAPAPASTAGAELQKVLSSVPGGGGGPGVADALKPYVGQGTVTANTVQYLVGNGSGGLAGGVIGTNS